ncbi:translation initiation factor IF-2-like [Vulpes lagopus]|uniref:translation initiation factor IF-2-like n=1 Tax=Vulpes lagopus TaxID=494514 RepID=UPI001BCA01E8|nr:translation initiation factor IF-2-like [Vulpes lagopus]
MQKGLRQIGTGPLPPLPAAPSRASEPSGTFCAQVHSFLSRGQGGGVGVKSWDPVRVEGGRRTFPSGSWSREVLSCSQAEPEPEPELVDPEKCCHQGLGRAGAPSRVYWIGCHGCHREAPPPWSSLVLRLCWRCPGRRLVTAFPSASETTCGGGDSRDLCWRRPLVQGRGPYTQASPSKGGGRRGRSPRAAGNNPGPAPAWASRPVRGPEEAGVGAALGTGREAAGSPEQRVWVRGGRRGRTKGSGRLLEGDPGQGRLPSPRTLRPRVPGPRGRGRGHGRAGGAGLRLSAPSRPGRRDLGQGSAGPQRPP